MPKTARTRAENPSHPILCDRLPPAAPIGRLPDGFLVCAVAASTPQHPAPTWTNGQCGGS